MNYTVRSAECGTCDNLWAFCLERSLSLLSSNGEISLIVPLSLVSTGRFSPALSLLKRDRLCRLLTLSGDAHPSVLFDGVKMSYTILACSNLANEATYVSKLYRWLSSERSVLFQSVQYTEARHHKESNLPFKMESSLHRQIIEKVCSHKTQIRHIEGRGGEPIIYHRIVRHFIKSFRRTPYFKNERDGEKRSDDYKLIGFSDKTSGLTVRAFLMSSSYYLFFVSLSDAYHCSRDLVLSFPICNEPIGNKLLSALHRKGETLETDLYKNSVRRRIVYKTTGLIEYDEFYPRKSKALADEIDTILATHYGFTPEELDFIINYDIKYRMGLGGGSSEEDEE